MFDCLYDMGDPVGASRHVRSSLRPDGTWMIGEPNAGRRSDVVETGGFARFRRVAETPFNLAFEVRP